MSGIRSPGGTTVLVNTINTTYSVPSPPASPDLNVMKEVNEVLVNGPVVASHFVPIRPEVIQLK